MNFIRILQISIYAAVGQQGAAAAPDKLQNYCNNWRCMIAVLNVRYYRKTSKTNQKLNA